MKRDLYFTFFLLMCLTLPLTAMAQVVDIPDPNLRAAIEAELGKALGATITQMNDNFDGLCRENANISDLTGLKYAIQPETARACGQHLRREIGERDLEH